jgi:glycerophosphoryl diester phosphodiesterase
VVGASRARSAALALGLSLALVLCLAGVGPGVGAAAVAGAPGRRAPVVDGAAGPSAVPTELTALVADFDGDHRSDLLWYGPGGQPDHLWLGRPDRAFVGVPVTVRGHYQPLVGDFDGDHRADVLWYGPGAAPDVLWFGQAGGRFAGRALTVPGSFEPFVADFDGDHRADVFWYAPGAAADLVWYGRADGHFSARAVTVDATFQPLVADFNGDGRRDVFWYAPGAGPDALWLGLGGGGFQVRPVAVGGTYQPLLGDWNGDRSGDILWYGPGTDPDALWLGRRDAGFTIRPAAVNGTYQPFTGDFDGDHRRDVVWYAPGAAADSVWYGGAGGAFASKPVTVVSRFQPKVGDFGGDGRGDVLWYAPGDPDDVLWFGLATRRFSSRATTVDIGHSRALPLRPGTIAGHFDPYGFVAHAMGSVNRHTYSNSLEAFRRNYARGFRVFETDVVRLKDGTALLAHTGLEASYGLHKPFQQATWADLRGHKYLGRYTILRSQDLVGLLRSHPDAYAILDSKYAELEIYRRFIRQAPERGLRERILPHVVDQAMLNALRTVYPLQNYVLALYRTQYHNRYDDPVVVDFTRRNRAPAVALWWRTRNPALSLNANHFQNRRYRASFVSALKAAGAVTYVHSIDAPADAQRFWSLRVGLYSNEPFPPLGTAPPQLLAPRFERGVTAA